MCGYLLVGSGLSAKFAVEAVKGGFGGRLAEYRYEDMDDVIKSSLDRAAEEQDVCWPEPK